MEVVGNGAGRRGTGYRGYTDLARNPATYGLLNQEFRRATAARPRPEPLLRVEGISVHFGAVQALSDVSLDIHRGEIVAIIGPNGAGKTTLLNVISGFYHPQRGRIIFDGKDRTDLKPFEVAELGIARTFQNVALFKAMTVLDNIMTGRLLKMRGHFLLDAIYWA